MHTFVKPWRRASIISFAALVAMSAGGCKYLQSSNSNLNLTNGKVVGQEEFRAEVIQSHRKIKSDGDTQPNKSTGPSADPTPAENSYAEVGRNGNPQTGSTATCTASVIAPTYILTAAHCVLDTKTAKKISADGQKELNMVVGTYDTVTKVPGKVFAAEVSTAEMTVSGMKQFNGKVETYRVKKVYIPFGYYQTQEKNGQRILQQIQSPNNPNDQYANNSQNQFSTMGLTDFTNNSGMENPNNTSNTSGDFDLAILELQDPITLDRYVIIPMKSKNAVNTATTGFNPQHSQPVLLGANNNAPAFSDGILRGKDELVAFGYGCNDAGAKAMDTTNSGKQQVGFTIAKEVRGSQLTIGGSQELARQCQGDSGGPTFKVSEPGKIPNVLVQIGVHSTKASDQTKDPEGHDVYLGSDPVQQFIKEIVPAEIRTKYWTL